MKQEITAGWGWWHSRHEDSGCSGPHATRDEAIAEAVGSGDYAEDAGGGRMVHDFWICEARQDPLRLADWVCDGGDMLERAAEFLAASDRTGWEGDDGPWFEASAEQEADLSARIKAACDEWQAAHGLVFTCSTFSAQRNMEPIRRETDADADAEGGAA